MWKPLKLISNEILKIWNVTQIFPVGNFRRFIYNYPIYNEFQKQSKLIKTSYSTLGFLKFETQKMLFLERKSSKNAILHKMIILELKMNQIKFFSKKKSIRKIKSQILSYLEKPIKMLIFQSKKFRIFTLKYDFDTQKV